MTAVLTGQITENNNGLRPLDPMSDLRGIADLIEEAFADDLGNSGQKALNELRWLSRLKPVLWWMVYSNPEHSDFLSGFVWQEDRKIVGNITINRTGAGTHRWLISNLAVSDNYRRRGIARGLMYAALELVNEYNGKVVSLQVRQDNLPARRLYDELQFNEVSGTTYLKAGKVPMVNQIPVPPGIRLRPRRFDVVDSRSAYNLACAATPLSVQKDWPIRQRHFQLGSSDHINNLFQSLWGAGPTEYWVVEDGQRFVATLIVTPGVFGKRHKIDLTVHPDWRGVLEKPLLSRALHYLCRWPTRGLDIGHPTFHPEAIQAYQELGLEKKQTLIWMKKEM
jgi:ribosomal protein S18 acetylase RimI-like enzyme